MRTITLDNPKLHKYISEKDALIRTGRKISQDIEKVEDQIAKHDAVEKGYTEQETPEIKEMIVRGDAVNAQIEALFKELGKSGDEIMAAKLALIPEKVKEKHYALRAAKEELERDRNKIFLKVQKIKDRIGPIFRKVIVPYLEKYEDTNTVKIFGQKIKVDIFSYLEEWKAKYEQRQIAKLQDPVLAMQEKESQEAPKPE